MMQLKNAINYLREMNRLRNVSCWIKKMMLTEFYFGKMIWVHESEEIAIYDFAIPNIS